MCKTVNLLVVLVFSVLLWSFDYGSDLTVWGFWWYCGLSCPDDDQCLEFVPPPLCRICVTVIVSPLCLVSFGCFLFYFEGQFSFVSCVSLASFLWLGLMVLACCSLLPPLCCCCRSSAVFLGAWLTRPPKKVFCHLVLVPVPCAALQHHQTCTV